MPKFPLHIVIGEWENQRWLSENFRFDKCKYKINVASERAKRLFRFFAFYGQLGGLERILVPRAKYCSVFETVYLKLCSYRMKTRIQAQKY